MIVVGLAGEKVFYASEPEAELFNARSDERHALLVAAVQQDAALVSYKEKRSERVGADIVDVAGDPVGLNRLIPGQGDVIVLRDEQRRENQCRQGCARYTTPHSFASTFAPSAPPSIGSVVRMTNSMMRENTRTPASEAGSFRACARVSARASLGGNWLRKNFTMPPSLEIATIVAAETMVTSMKEKMPVIHPMRAPLRTLRICPVR